MTYYDEMMTSKITYGYLFKILILGAERRGVRAEVRGKSRPMLHITVGRH